MKVVKIKKNYINGTIEHNLVILETLYTYSDEDIDYLVQEWCENDSSGLNNGYRYSWSLVNDRDVIEESLIDEIRITNIKIIELESKKFEFEKHLSLI